MHAASFFLTLLIVKLKDGGIIHLLLSKPIGIMSNSFYLSFLLYTFKNSFLILFAGKHDNRLHGL